MKATDWDEYYKKPYRTAHLSRSITAANLLRYMRNGIQQHPAQRPTITEIGGANSCFFEAIYRSFAPAKYQIIDNNEQGLNRFRQRISPDKLSIATLINSDVLKIEGEKELEGYQLSDIVFSIGLVEHFPPEKTSRVIKAHFDLVKPGGLVIISSPTPTLLYRAARYIAEKAGMWIFHDERPMKVSELADEMERSGQILYKKIIWPIVFTQVIVAARKS